MEMPRRGAMEQRPRAGEAQKPIGWDLTATQGYKDIATRKGLGTGGQQATGLDWVQVRQMH